MPVTWAKRATRCSSASPIAPTPRARQLAAWLAPFGVEARTVDLRSTPGILHLKSGVVALDPGRLFCIDALATHPAFANHAVLCVPRGEADAANCVRVNDVLFVADGYPATHAMLRQSGLTLESLAMSECAKMDGG
jgi:dimethylargininase